MQQIVDFVTAQETATMSVEEWFDTYGVAILKREEAKKQRKTMAARAGR